MRAMILHLKSKACCYFRVSPSRAEFCLLNRATIVTFLVRAAVQPYLLPDADVLLLIGLGGFRGFHLMWME